MHKNSKINPIKDWSINKIIISKYPIDKKYKDTYAILDQINEQNVIVSLLDIINGEYKEDISEQKIVNIVLLLVFKEYPSLALRGDIIKIDEKFYLCIGDKYYDIDIALSQYLIPYV